MSNHIQIEPATTTIYHIKTEPKRSSNLYTCISKLRKMRTEIRKHRTLPSNLIYQEKFLLQEEEEHESQDLNDYNEKIDIIDIKSPPLSWSIRHTTQLAFPPRFNLVHHDDLLPPIQDQEFDSSSSSTCSCSSHSKFNHQDSDDDDDEEERQYNYVYGDSDAYSATFRKLSGISFENQDKPKTNTAVLITLSPCALAAANAARQKRQKARVQHY
ncbi:hypothetical protein [Parasitella parasitica]|uniref:Uncharacterized protein n=1 Tax=Parasitella parasitica TaxID=35722 RepID=A0A0B7NMN1_9FUNG|nr:hypothetical protein [Parasitella parasitica]